MSQPNDPSWGGGPGPGFMGHQPAPNPQARTIPVTMPAQHQASQATMPLADLVNTLDKDPGRRLPPFDAYTLPESVMHPQDWRGSDCDRVYGIRQPTAAEIKQLIAEKADFENTPPRFVVMLGAEGFDHDGKPIIIDGPADYRLASSWWARISVKARVLVTNEFVTSFMPSDAEGESLRASKRRVG